MNLEPTGKAPDIRAYILEVLEPRLSALEATKPLTESPPPDTMPAVLTPPQEEFYGWTPHGDGSRYWNPPAGWRNAAGVHVVGIIPRSDLPSYVLQAIEQSNEQFTEREDKGSDNNPAETPVIPGENE